MRNLPDDNLAYPVLIEIGTSSGSGFCLNWQEKEVWLATARHVLFQKESDEPYAKTLTLTAYDQDPKRLDPVVLEIDLDKAQIKQDKSADVALLKVGNLKEGKLHFSEGVVGKLTPAGVTIVLVMHERLKSFDEALVGNEVFVLGYPNSLIRNDGQLEAKRPLLRSGIIAGKNHTNRTLVLDCPVYFGNSGGLAIEVEAQDTFTRHFRVIGVVTEFVPFIETWYNMQHGYTNANVANSGYSIVVPTDHLIRMLST